jgi:hypothetical protein
MHNDRTLASLQTKRNVRASAFRFGGLYRPVHSGMKQASFSRFGGFQNSGMAAILKKGTMVP